MLCSPESVPDKLLVLLLFWWSGNIPEEEEGELHCANARRQLTSDDDLGATAAAPLIAVASVRPSVVRRLSGAVEHFNGDFQFLSVRVLKEHGFPSLPMRPLLRNVSTEE